MRYLEVKNGKEEEDHWIGLSDLERERFEHHADFLIDQGYMEASWQIGHAQTRAPRPRALRVHAGSQGRLEIAKLPAARGTRVRGR